jgi:hypothetical protein
MIRRSVNCSTAIRRLRARQTKSQPTMFCYDDPTPPGFEKWQYTYVGTIKLDGASERDFESDKKWKVDVLCTRTGDQKFECIQSE